MMDWMIEVVAKLGYSKETLIRAFWIFSRFIGIQGTQDFN